MYRWVVLPSGTEGESRRAEDAKEVALSFSLWLSVRPRPLTSVIWLRVIGPTGTFPATPLSRTVSLFQERNVAFWRP